MLEAAFDGDASEIRSLMEEVHLKVVKYVTLWDCMRCFESEGEILIVDLYIQPLWQSSR